MGLGLWSLGFQAMNRWATFMSSLRDADAAGFAGRFPCRCATPPGMKPGSLGRIFTTASSRPHGPERAGTRAQRAPLPGGALLPLAVVAQFANTAPGHVIPRP